MLSHVNNSINNTLLAFTESIAEQNDLTSTDVNAIYVLRPFGSTKKLLFACVSKWFVKRKQIVPFEEVVKMEFVIVQISMMEKTAVTPIL